MATAAEVEAYRASQRNVTTLAIADLARFWRTLDLSDSAAVAQAMREFFPDLVQIYGETSALLAVEYYDDLREGAGLAGFFAEMADVVDADQSSAVAGWGVGALFAADPDLDQALSNLALGLQRLVQQAGRDTIAHNVDRDPVRVGFARVPHGKTCAFCLMLASRGAVYGSARSAGQMNRYHGKCDCVPTPIFEGAGLPYDADALYDQYVAARDNAEGRSSKAVLARLRQERHVA